MKQCLLCLDYTEENLCSPCKSELPWVLDVCSRCGRHSQASKICCLCLKEPCLWDRAHAPLHYLPPITQFVSQLKFFRQFYQARTLVDLFVETLPAGPLPELLLPVPLHPWRMLWRGFNQSTELARLLSKRLNVPYSPDYIKRMKYSAAQRGSNKLLRKDNVKGAFCLKRPLPFSHIALIDDVLTTGETLSDMCRAIRLIHPNIRIDIWTMAQVILT